MSDFNPRLVAEAREHLRAVVRETPLQFHAGLSHHFGAKIYLKREDLQIVRSYKLRGAYNRMRLLTPSEKKRGIVCASAGNHAQGVAFSCKALKTQGIIFWLAQRRLVDAQSANKKKKNNKEKKRKKIWRAR